MQTETLLLVVVFVVGLLPLVTAMRGGFRIGAAVCALLGSLLLWTSIRQWPRVISEHEVVDRPIRVEQDEYVTSDKCEACHPHEYATWHASYHRTMTQVATPETVIPEFDGTRLEWNGQHVLLERRGDEFWVDMEDPEWNGAVENTPRVQRRIVLTTGAHHMQIFWAATRGGRRLSQLPFNYYRVEERWIPDHASFLRPPGDATGRLRGGAAAAATGGWAGQCMRCHSTHGKARFPLPEVAEADTHVSEFGITCEACHGPAAEHVRVNRDPLRRYRHRLGEEADPTIVQPQRLSHRRSTEICGQCHSIYSMDADKLSDWNTHGFRYRPGDELGRKKDLVRIDSDVRHVGFVKEFSFWKDGMVRVSGREYNGLVETPCYEQGDMSCLSCHVMHKPADDPRSLEEWANDQLKLGMDSDDACLQCHDSFRGDIEGHTHHAASSTGSRCYNCHMPYTTYGLLKAIRSHQVDSPTVQSSLETGRPNACNQCHLNETMAWAAEHLESWFDIPAPVLNERQRTIAASVLWGIQGDAGQRALVAWSMGWGAAREASGTRWMPPFLAQLLVDDYDVVRFIAYRSLRTLPGFANLEYDFVGPDEGINTAVREVIRLWNERETSPQNEAVLVDSEGAFRQDLFLDLLNAQDKRPLRLNE